MTCALAVYFTGWLVALTTSDAGPFGLEVLNQQPLRLGLWLNPDASEMVPRLEVSSDLAEWQTATGAEVTLNSALGRLTWEFKPGAPAGFYRVVFTSLGDPPAPAPAR